jgi:hypothetical protein
MYSNLNKVFERLFLYLSEDKVYTVRESLHFRYGGLSARSLPFKGASNKQGPVPPI